MITGYDVSISCRCSGATKPDLLIEDVNGLQNSNSTASARAGSRCLLWLEICARSSSSRIARFVRGYKLQINHLLWLLLLSSTVATLARLRRERAALHFRIARAGPVATYVAIEGPTRFAQ